jgi:hypothetical protein
VPVTADYIAANHLMMLLTDQGWLDIFDFVPGFPEADVQQVFDESIPAGGTRYVSLNWLKRMKGASDRSKDAEDLKHLEE